MCQPLESLVCELAAAADADVGQAPAAGSEKLQGPVCNARAAPKADMLQHRHGATENCAEGDIRHLRILQEGRRHATVCKSIAREVVVFIWAEDCCLLKSLGANAGPVLHTVTF